MKKILLILAILAFPLQSFAFTAWEFTVTCQWVINNSDWAVTIQAVVSDPTPNWITFPWDWTVDAFGNPTISAHSTYWFSSIPEVRPFWPSWAFSISNPYDGELLFPPNDCTGVSVHVVPLVATRLTVPQGTEIVGNVTTVWFNLVEILVLLAPVILFIASFFIIFKLIRRAFNI